MEPDKISYQRIGEYYKEVLRRTEENLELDGSLEKNLKLNLEIIKDASKKLLI